MASHITCHANDIFPNTFPPPKPMPKDHGFVSRYEQSHFMKSFGPSNLDDEIDDSVPAQFKPLPMRHSAGETITAESALCLTPNEKQSKKAKSRTPYSPDKYQNYNNNALLKDSKGKSLKVSFDPVIDVKHMSPEQNHVESDISIVDVGQIDESVIEEAEAILKKLDISKDSVTDSAEARSKSDLDSSYKPVLPEVRLKVSKDEPKLPVPFSNPENSEVSQIVKSLSSSRKNIGRVSPLQTTVDTDLEVPFTSQAEHVLARPEFNSTALKMKQLQKLKDEQPDVSVAVQEMLKNDTVRNKIEEKAFSKVNVKSDQFKNLPSLQVQEEDLINKAEKKLTSKVKPFKRPKNTSELIGKAPDVMEFFSPGLQRESASFTVPGLVKPQFKPRTAPRDSATDLYKHLRAWEQLD